MGSAMTFVVGVLAGLLIVQAWRLVRSLRAERRGDYLDVKSKERLEMLVKDGAR